MRNASNPVKFSVWTAVVPPGVLVLGVKKNSCFPVKSPYNDPSHLKLSAEFSCRVLHGLGTTGTKQVTNHHLGTERHSIQVDLDLVIFLQLGRSFAQVHGLNGPFAPMLVARKVKELQDC